MKYKKYLGIPDRIWANMIGLITGVILLSLCSCSTYRLSTLNHDPIYGSNDVVLQVPADVQIDTLSVSQLRWKLRTDFRFRYDFATYAMNQPYSWYMSNYRYSYWRPYNSFDVYWNRHSFWNDWAFSYPYNYGWNSWNRPYWGWNRPYNPWNNWYQGPWHNPGYNVVWNSSRRGERNIAYINGPRGSRGNSIIQRDNSNIENRIVVNRNKPRNNNNTIDNAVNELREKFNIKPRVYNNPNNVRINNNNSKPRVYNRVENSNNNTPPRIYNRPPPNTNNSSVRASSNISRGNSNSRGGNSNRKN